MTLSLVWDSVRDHFFRPESLERVALMRRFDRRKEQWFQVELMWLLDRLTRCGQVSRWEPEHKYVDFRIDVAGLSAVVELKTAVCGRDSKGVLWKPCQYGKGECAEGVRQLGAAPPPRYLVVFGWPGVSDPALTIVDWNEMLEAVRSKTAKPGINFVREPERTSGGELSVGIFQVP